MKPLIAALLGVTLGATQAPADPAATAALNALRAANGRPPLTYSDALQKAAERHALDMAGSGVFSHTGSDGSDVAARVAATGYGWCVVAENIAKGQRDLSQVMQAWEASPGHLANMTSADVRDFALVEGQDFIWVMVLAAPGC